MTFIFFRFKTWHVLKCSSQNMTHCKNFSSKSDENPNFVSKTNALWIFWLKVKFSTCSSSSSWLITSSSIKNNCFTDLRWRNCLFWKQLPVIEPKVATHEKSPINFDQPLFWPKTMFYRDSWQIPVEHELWKSTKMIEIDRSHIDEPLTQMELQSVVFISFVEQLEKLEQLDDTGTQNLPVT